MKHVSNLIVLFVLTIVPGIARADVPREGFITTPDKVRIFYKIEGSGPDTLVVVHGGPGNTLESIRPDLGRLANGRRVIYYDQRGQGGSDLITDGKKLGYEHHVADLDALRKHFNLEKMTLLGNSWGGLLVSLYAVAHPERVQRLVLHNPAPPIKGFLNDMRDEIERRINALYNGEKLKRLRFAEKPENWLNAKDVGAICRDFLHGLLAVYTYSRTLDIGLKGNVCSGPSESLRHQLTVNYHVWNSLGDFNVVTQLSAVKAPVLVIHGAADVIPLRGSEFWASGYPNARLLLIEKAGHIAHVETPEVFFPAVETFLKGAFPADARKIKP